MTMRTPDPNFPSARISNGLIEADVYLPDVDKGFYRSTRFDWSGIIARLNYGGHEYYGPWYAASDPPVWDYEYRSEGLVTGAQSTIMGPAEEFFYPQGYDEAKPGDTFVKIGVGALRRADDKAYSPFAQYEFADHGTWTSRPSADGVEFTHELNNPGSGYGYTYHKTLRLVAGKPELVIEHRLTNTGSKPIQTDQYNHNFLALDDAKTGPDYELTVPFQIQTIEPPDPAIARIDGNKIRYLKQLEQGDVAFCVIEGFGSGANDYDVHIKHARLGAGMRVTADKPLSRMMLWSIPNTVCMEPFIDVSIHPEETTSWTLTYRYENI